MAELYYCADHWANVLFLPKIRREVARSGYRGSNPAWRLIVLNRAAMDEAFYVCAACYEECEYGP